MPEHIKILLAEDLPSDAELALYETGKVLNDFDYKVVDNRVDFMHELENFHPDMIISDYQMPAFDGMTALRLAIEHDPLIPVIILTGSMNEDTAVECMKAGATDYVIKEHIKRLGQAILHALDEKEVRARKKQAEEALIKSEEKYRTIFENVQDVFYQVNMEGQVLEISPSIRFYTDFRREQVLGNPVSDLYFDAEDRVKLLEALHQNGEIRDYELRIKTESGFVKYGSINARLVYNAEGLPDHIDGSIRDITERVKIEENLRNSEEKFRNLFENHAAVNVIIDSQTLRIVDANRAAEKFYGYTINELKNLKVTDLNIAENNIIQSALTDTLRELNGQFQFKHRLKNGQIRDVEVYSSHIIISGISYVHSVLHDITERKKSEEQVRLLSKAIQQSPVIIIIADHEGYIQYVNSSFTTISGYSFDEVLEQKTSLLKSGEHQPEFYKKIWDCIQSGSEWTGEILNKKKNGELFWSNVSISPLVDESGKITHYVSIQEDVSEKRKMLEDLVIAKDKAEAGDKLKTAFINNISHEVRTPLNGIIGFSEMLLNPDVTSENKTLFGDIIKKSSRRLLNTITSYMDISMIVSETMEVQKKVFPLNQVLDELQKEFSVLAKEKGLSITLSRPDIPANLQLESDPDLINKILSHLLDNALKFTLEGGIEFGFSKTGSNLDLFVNDTGIGIDKDKVNLIKENFMQADVSTTRGYEGSGLGLSIAQGLSKLLGGELLISSEKGKGSSILVRLPDSLIIVKKTEPELPRIIPLVQKDPLILVAEDDEFNYKFLEIVLKKAGFPVVRAENGLEAVKICKTNSEVTLVLMDLKMPIMGGIEATREIKSFLPDLPIIALTAYVSNQDEYEALISGCDDYIPKPVNRVKLLELIRKISGRES